MRRLGEAVAGGRRKIKAREMRFVLKGSLKCCSSEDDSSRQDCLYHERDSELTQGCHTGD
jgi:hypothetical protein